MIKDMPDDFKIEHDRLVYEVEPLVTRLWELLQGLPKTQNHPNRSIYSYNGFEMEIHTNKKE